MLTRQIDAFRVQENSKIQVRLELQPDSVQFDFLLAAMELWIETIKVEFSACLFKHSQSQLNTRLALLVYPVSILALSIIGNVDAEVINGRFGLNFKKIIISIPDELQRAASGCRHSTFEYFTADMLCEVVA